MLLVQVSASIYRRHDTHHYPGWAGGVLGMSTSFFVGPVGGSFGLPPFGGDIGFPMAMGFTAVTYPPLRYLEKRYFKN